MSILNDYGKFKRYLLTDAGYQLCSQWTSSNTVHFDDGKTAQDKLGAINGITDSLTSGSSDFALSAKAGKSLQEQISELNTGMAESFKIVDLYDTIGPDGYERPWLELKKQYSQKFVHDGIYAGHICAGCQYFYMGRVVSGSSCPYSVFLTISYSAQGRILLISYSNKIWTYTDLSGAPIVC